MSKEGEIESIETPAASSLPEQQPTSDDDADDGPDPFAGMAKGNYTIPDDYVNPLLITEAPENMEDHPELVALSELVRVEAPNLNRSCGGVEGGGESRMFKGRLLGNLL